MGDVTVGWPVLADDWMSLFPDYRRTKGYKMWMMAADGSRQFGPLGARCFGGANKYGCAPGNFVGRDLAQAYDHRLLQYLGSAWKDQMPDDKECYKNGCPQSKKAHIKKHLVGQNELIGCYKQTGQFQGYKQAESDRQCCADQPDKSACWIEAATNGTYKLFTRPQDSRRPEFECMDNRRGKCIQDEEGKCIKIKFRPNMCLHGEAWRNDNFPKTNNASEDGFRYLVPTGRTPYENGHVDRVYASAVKNGTVPDGAKSCRRYYAPELKLFKLELGISPDRVPKGWVQWPTVGNNHWWEWSRSEPLQTYKLCGLKNALRLSELIELVQPHSVKQSGGEIILPSQV